MTQTATPEAEIAPDSISTTTDRRTLQRVAVASACGILTLHFCFTFLHVAPLNPVSQQLSGVTSAWTSPFFTQNWELFAPDPVSRDTGVLVTGSINGAPINQYVDLSTPLLERKLHNLLPDNLHYTVSSVGHNILSARQDVVEDSAVLAAHPDASDQGLLIDPAVLADAPHGIRNDYIRARSALVALAATAIEREYGTVPDAVQIRIVTHEFPRWSQRADSGIGDVVYSDTPWMDLEGNEVTR